MMNLFKAEWNRLWYLKFTRKYMIIMLLVSLLTGLVLVMTTSLTEGKAFTDLSVNDVYTVLLLSLDVLSVMLILYTGITIGSEFSSGAIHTSLLTTPQRPLLMLSKTVVFTCFSAVFTLIVTILIFLLGQILLASHGMQFMPGYDIFRLAAGSAVMPLFYTLISVLLAFVFGSTSGAITGTLVLLFIPAITNITDEALHPLFVPLFPASAIHSLGGIAKGSEKMPVIVSFILLIAWLGLIWLIATIRFNRKDI